VLADLSLLIRLQVIDEELADIEAELGDQPEQLENLKRETNRYRTEIDELNAKLLETQDQKKEQRQLIESAKERLKKSQSVIFSVKTTREYDAVSSEIEQSNTIITNSEKLRYDLNMREEHIQIKINELNVILSNTEIDYNEHKSDMQEQINSSFDEVDALRTERESIVNNLKPPVYSHYQRIRKLRDGIGITHMANNACGYCFSRVPPQRQVEIRRMDDIILCEACGCIMVVE